MEEKLIQEFDYFCKYKCKYSDKKEQKIKKEVEHEFVCSECDHKNEEIINVKVSVNPCDTCQIEDFIGVARDNL